MELLHVFQVYTVHMAASATTPHTIVLWTQNLNIQLTLQHEYILAVPFLYIFKLECFASIYFMGPLPYASIVPFTVTTGGMY